MEIREFTPADFERANKQNPFINHLMKTMQDYQIFGMPMAERIIHIANTLGSQQLPEGYAESDRALYLAATIHFYTRDPEPEN